MAGIWNINSAYNVENKRVSTKLSFEIGEKFLARVVELNKDSGSLLLRLLDGWQFSASIDNPGEISLSDLLKFKVEGFEDGKLKLSIVVGDEKSSQNINDAVELFIKENSANLTDKDYDIIRNMVKHNIPLTKENISNIKTLVEFSQKLQADDGEKNNFIQKYLSSKNINPESIEGKDISRTLGKFFDDFSKLDTKDVFTFIENNIDFNTENIESFNKVFKKPSAIYGEISNLEKAIGKFEIEQGFKEIASVKQEEVKGDNSGPVNSKNGVENVTANLGEEEIKVQDKIQTSKDDKLQTSEKKDSLSSEKISKDQIESKIESKSQSKVELKVESDDYEPKQQISSAKENTKFDKAASIIKNMISEYGMKDNSKDMSGDFIKDMANNIKKQVNLKTKEMADTIQRIISDIDNTSDSGHVKNTNLASVLKNNMNDFKVFNTVSNSYYYMDLPFKLQDSDYGCKLIIKDDRKRGKKIDSKNVKIAASVNTQNLGTVDAYLTVNNNNMHVNIKSYKSFVGILENYSKKILESLSELGYNIDVDFDEKEEEMSISTCRDFFQNSNMGTINTRA